MTFRPCLSPRTNPLGRASLLMLACLTAATLATAADDDESSWKEKATDAPETFNIDKLQPFTVSQGSAMTYGIDPETLTVGEDSVVRYVMVARSASGALNVFYEGIRCGSAEVKTYARWDNNRRAWHTPANAEWKSLVFAGATRPAMVLATEGLCNGKSVNGTPRKMLAALKNGMHPRY